MQYALALLGISILIIIHEGGHYLAARAAGMRVLRYSIGFGPALFKYKPKNSPTTFQLCLIPLMAYVQIAGMANEEPEDSDDPGLFGNKSLAARAFTIFAGPLANYAAASVLIIIVGFMGWPTQVPIEPMTVGAISEGSPAAKAGIQPGDVVLAVEGKQITSLDQLITATSPRANTKTVYRIQREGKAPEDIEIVPELKNGRGMIGVGPKTNIEYQKLTVGQALYSAVTLPYIMTVQQLKGIGQLISRRTTQGLVGPVGMVTLFAEPIKKNFTDALTIMIQITIALGMLNLMPFPALDGGRLLFLGYEAITRQKANQKIETIVHAAGLVFLLSMLVLVTFRDVSNL